MTIENGYDIGTSSTIDGGNNTDYPVVVSKTTIVYLDKNNDYATTTILDGRKLYLCMLGCEPNPPYGPNPHTAQMILEIIICAIERTSKVGNKKSISSEHDESSLISVKWEVMIDVYDVQQYQYPRDWSVYHGILIPGSFASAYDDDDWIQKLKHNIQNIIVPNQYRTLAICFGHQVIAHSFGPNGLACRTPSGFRIGPQYTQLSPIGKSCYESTLSLKDWQSLDQQREKTENENMSSIDTTDPSLSSSYDRLKMLVTHSDMVQLLPETAICLGGCPNVPVQMAAYFATLKNKEDFIMMSSSLSSSSHDRSTTRTILPYAITFQAHPEYATSYGYTSSYQNCLQTVYEKHNLVSEERYQQLMHDIISNTSSSSIPEQSDSIDSIYMACRLLQWF